MTATSFAATVFRIATGEIVASTQHSCDPEFQDVILSNILAYWGEEEFQMASEPASSDLHYVVTLDDMPTVVDRPVLSVSIDKTDIVAGSGDFVTLTGLPDPCEIVLDAADPTVATQTYQVAGGGFEFDAATPGVYTIEVHRFPFLPWKIEVIAT